MSKTINLWTLGNLEHKILPTKDGIERLKAAIRQGRKQTGEDGTFDLVWGPELSLTSVTVSDNTEDIVTAPNSDKKVAVIFGVTGMDGSYLADLLLHKEYKVIGVKRRSSTNNEWRIKHLADEEDFSVMSGDLTDYSSLVKVFGDIGHVDEIYNLAAQSHVGESFKQPGITWDITGKGCMNILQCLVDLKMTHVKFYQASSSEMYGSSYNVQKLSRDGINWKEKKYQDENTKHLPQSPYAIAKCAAHMTVRLYREAYGIHASAGILFNHEGPRRGENFVTKKITKWVGDFLRWKEDQGCWIGELNFSEDYIIAPNCRRFSKLRLGNLKAQRDWGHAKDYVKAMHLMLQQDEPDDYVICTGEARSVSDFLDVAFKHIGIDEWSDYVVIDPQFYRPAEVDFLQGDCSKAKRVLNWKQEYSFEDLVKEMVTYDINKANEKV